MGQIYFFPLFQKGDIGFALQTFAEVLFAFSGGTAVHARDFLVYGRQYAVVLVIGLLVSTPLPEKLWRRIRTSPLGTVLLLVLFWVCVYCMAVATNDPFMYFSF